MDFVKKKSWACRHLSQHKFTQTIRIKRFNLHKERMIHFQAKMRMVSTTYFCNNSGSNCFSSVAQHKSSKVFIVFI